MERILVVGCPGSGKSTLSFALADRLRLPVVHLDQLFWRAGWQQVSQEEFSAQLDEALQGPRWILDGNYDRTLERRLAVCDTAILLDYPRWRCLLGVTRRVLGSYGRDRPDMTAGCPEHFEWEFMQYIWQFRRKQGVKIERLLTAAEQRGVRVLRFRTRKACQKWLQTLPQKRDPEGSLKR
ncbi:MAG: topology modulation protein [Eubacteriales bacterium]|nr:topology modulation protein [Eubacteriales bacterium]